MVLKKDYIKSEGEMFFSLKNIFLDGKRVVMKDSNNETVIPIMYNNELYIPVSTVADMLEENIHIEGENIFIGNKPSDKNPLNICCYPLENTCDISIESNTMTFFNESYAIYPLYKNFKKLCFKIEDTEIKTDAKLHIQADFDIIYSALLSESVDKNITIDVADVEALKIFVTASSENVSFNLYELFIS